MAPFIEVLNEGYRSEIIYSFRFRDGSRQNPGGDGLYSWSVIKNAGKDFLTGRFYIRTGEDEVIFDDTALFSAAFFSCRIPAPPQVVAGEYHIEVKADTDLIRRPAPLSLLDPFLTYEKNSTGWVRYGD